MNIIQLKKASRIQTQGIQAPAYIMKKEMDASAASINLNSIFCRTLPDGSQHTIARQSFRLPDNNQQDYHIR